MITSLCYIYVKICILFTRLQETCHHLASALSTAHKENYKLQVELYKSEKNREALIREQAQTSEALLASTERVKALEEQLANVTSSHAR